MKRNRHREKPQEEEEDEGEENQKLLRKVAVDMKSLVLIHVEGAQTRGVRTEEKLPVRRGLHTMASRRGYISASCLHMTNSSTKIEDTDVLKTSTRAERLDISKPQLSLLKKTREKQQLGRREESLDRWLQQVLSRQSVPFQRHADFLRLSLL